jgi:hypothetical protein
LPNLHRIATDAPRLAHGVNFNAKNASWHCVIPVPMHTQMPGFSGIGIASFTPNI